MKISFASSIASLLGVTTCYAQNTFPTPSENVGIGTANPDAKLTVNGTIHAKEVKVDTSIPVPDYVFNKDYALISLDDVKKYISTNKHLPEILSVKVMEKEGINLSEMKHQAT